MNLDFWDVVTFFALLIVVAGFTVIFIWFITLPGKMAIKRKHPHAESVKLMGNLGFLGGLPWLHALIWAIHDSVTVDIRRGPKEEREYVEREIERLTAGSKKHPETPADEKNPPEDNRDDRP